MSDNFLTRQRGITTISKVKISSNLAFPLGHFLFWFFDGGIVLESLIFYKTIFSMMLIITHEAGHAIIARKLCAADVKMNFGLINSCVQSKTTIDNHEKIAFGGIFAQIILLILYFCITRGFGISIPAGDYMFFLINAILMVSNALPIKPLDGYTMFQFISRKVGARGKNSMHQ